MSAAVRDPGRTVRARSKSKTAAARVRGAEHQQQCLDLKKRGLSFSAIAKRLGLSKSTVAEHVWNGLAELRALATEDAGQLRQLELERTEELWSKLYPRIQKSDVRAIEAGVRLILARARLLGLEAPVKVAAVHVDVARLTDAQLEQLIASGGDPSALALAQGGTGGAVISEPQEEQQDGDSVVGR